MARRLTNLEKKNEYKKERKRVLALANRAKKKGFIIPDGLIPPLVLKQPLQKDINALKEITSYYFYSHVIKLDKETSKYITGREAIRKKRSESAKAVWITKRYNEYVSKHYPNTSDNDAKKESTNSEFTLVGQPYFPQITSIDDAIQMDSMPMDEFFKLRERYAEQERERQEEEEERRALEEENQEKLRIQQAEENYLHVHDDETDEDRKRWWKMWEEEKQREFERRAKKREQQEEKDERKYADVTSSILQWVREEIDRWTPDNNWSKSLTDTKVNEVNVLERILNAQIAKDGEQAVAKRLEENAEAVKTMVMEVLLSSGGSTRDYESARDRVNFNLVAFAAILKGENLTPDEAREFTDMMDYYDIEE